jgi:hypothetical protein
MEPTIAGTPTETSSKSEKKVTVTETLRATPYGEGPCGCIGGQSVAWWSVEQGRKLIVELCYETYLHITTETEAETCAQQMQQYWGYPEMEWRIRDWEVCQGSMGLCTGNQ